MDNRFYAGGLCFVEIAAPSERAEDIATFTAVRALRQMPTLRCCTDRLSERPLLPFAPNSISF